MLDLFNCRLQFLTSVGMRVDFALEDPKPLLVVLEFALILLGAVVEPLYAGYFRIDLTRRKAHLDESGPGLL